MNLENCGIAVSEKRDCFLCGKQGQSLYSGLTDRLFDAPGEWDVLQCVDCRLIWLRTIPLPSDIAKTYPACDPVQKSDLLPQQSSPVKQFLRNCILDGALGYSNLNVSAGGKLLGKLLGTCTGLGFRVASSVNFLRGDRRGILLDVGCGTGDYLLRMKNLGWDVRGVEPDENSSVVAIRSGIDVSASTLESAPFENGTLDAVTFAHVLEHIDDPLRALKHVRNLLRPGGELIIITPNLESMFHSKFGSSWYHLDIPRHLHMFSPKSLRILLEQSGFIEKRVFTVNRNAVGSYCASRLIHNNGHLNGFFSDSKGVNFNVKAGARIFSTFNMLSSYRHSGDEVIAIFTCQTRK